ncbi:unnamed protein product [Protopolystoma xenopodis]|uniref:Steroid dehydrogenase n=1 Tax=Protopolystoma xenopodis TaxID=117903 RepID=A0A3S5CHY2_9PLAT|nr:unnamed protein product [Protopolystoma xenopodis]
MKSFGEWAIITGATDGIGKAFAEELAKDGLNIMLISRNIDKLRRVACELEECYKVKTEIDFYDKLEAAVNGLSSICCLINNVGMSLTYPDSFASSPLTTADKIKDIVLCNVLSASIMSRIVSSKLENQASRAYIINISSYSGTIPVPLLALYAGTKAFIWNFSRSLSLESSKVVVKTLAPGFVSTSMTHNRRTSILVPSAHQYACSALNTLGVEAHGAGYLPHALFAIVVNAVPSFIRSRLVYSQMHSLRAKTLKKMENTSKKTG